MRTDFDTLEDGTVITLFPNAANPLHKKPINAMYANGYFYCDGTPPSEGPDYYLGDALKFNDGFEVQP